MTSETRNWWVKLLAGSEPIKDPKLALRRIFLRLGLIVGSVFAGYLVILFLGTDEPISVKVLVPLGVFLFLVGFIFLLGLVMGFLTKNMVGSERGD